MKQSSEVGRFDTRQLQGALCLCSDLAHPLGLNAYYTRRMSRDLHSWTGYVL